MNINMQIMILFNKFYPFFNGWNIHINVEFKYSTIKRGGVFFYYYLH